MGNTCNAHCCQDKDGKNKERAYETSFGKPSKQLNEPLK